MPKTASFKSDQNRCISFPIKDDLMVFDDCNIALSNLMRLLAPELVWSFVCFRIRWIEEKIFLLRQNSNVRITTNRAKPSCATTHFQRNGTTPGMADDTHTFQPPARSFQMFPGNLRLSGTSSGKFSANHRNGIMTISSRPPSVITKPISSLSIRSRISSSFSMSNDCSMRSISDSGGSLCPVSPVLS